MLQHGANQVYLIGRGDDAADDILAHRVKLPGARGKDALMLQVARFRDHTNLALILVQVYVNIIQGWSSSSVVWTVFTIYRALGCHGWEPAASSHLCMSSHRRRLRCAW